MSETSEIYVKDSASLQTLIDQLSSYLTDFNNKYTDINKEQQTLVQKWSGDASNAFQERWQKESPAFSSFADLVGRYVTALEEIKGQYETAEGQAAQVAGGQG